MTYYGSYAFAAAWLSAWSIAYGIFMWIAVVFAPMDPAVPWLFVGTQALKYAFMLVVGAGPLFIIAKRYRRFH